MNPIYTAGYGGHRAMDLKRIAQKLGAIVADIRIRPTSTRPEWTKSELTHLLGERYVHVPELGNKNAHTGGPIEIADEPGGVLKIVRLARRAPVILLCGCPNLADCHRLVVSELLAPNVRAAGAPPIGEVEWPVRTSEPGKMKCLSLWQPWGSLIAIGAKRIETRPWSTPYRGLLAIHAAQKRQELACCWDDDFYPVLLEHGLVPPLRDEHLPMPTFDERKRLVREGLRDGWLKMPLGEVVAVARLVDCVPTENLRAGLSAQELAFGNYERGRFGWVLEEVRALPQAVPTTGNRMLFDIDAAPIEAALRGEAPAVRAASPVAPRPRKPKVLAEAYAAPNSEPEAEPLQPTLF